MTKDEALDLALEALTATMSTHGFQKYIDQAKENAITAIKQARALDKKAENARELGLDYEPVLKDNSNYRYDPPVAEPVAWICNHYEEGVKNDVDYWQDDIDALPVGTPLYTAPPAQRQWVGLTDEEWESMYDKFAKYQEYGSHVSGWGDFAKAIEAKLRSKNNG